MAEGRYAVEFTAEGRANLGALKAADRQRVATAIQTSLLHEPTVPTRNRKQLTGVEAGFDFIPPLWELRVGDFRVFFDVTPGDGRTVTVRAVRRKRPTQTTQEVLS